jgi:ferrous iron transport protein B
VEKKEGHRSFEGYDIRVVDLPGVYGLTAYSPDEMVARNFIIEEKPDVVVDIVDATNLERNLYLSVELMEMEVPLIMALNMMDEAESRQYRIDVEAISKEMGIPVIPMVANRNQGTDNLLKEVVRVAEDRTRTGGVRIEYGREVERQIAAWKRRWLKARWQANISARWLAVKLIEGDAEVVKRFEEARSG